jgi:hypothetical protein
VRPRRRRPLERRGPRWAPSGSPTSPGSARSSRTSCSSRRAVVPLPGAVRDAAARVLELVQQWLADGRFDASTLVVLTGDAVGPGACDLAGAAVWGAGALGPGREPRPAGAGRRRRRDRCRSHRRPRAGAALRHAISTGEPQFAVRAPAWSGCRGCSR